MQWWKYVVEGLTHAYVELTTISFGGKIASIFLNYLIVNKINEIIKYINSVRVIFTIASIRSHNVLLSTVNGKAHVLHTVPYCLW